jgi:hypothetical protein
MDNHMYREYKYKYEDDIEELTKSEKRRYNSLIRESQFEYNNEVGSIDYNEEDRCKSRMSRGQFNSVARYDIKRFGGRRQRRRARDEDEYPEDEEETKIDEAKREENFKRFFWNPEDKLEEKLEK